LLTRGADVLDGDLRYPSETGWWQLGDLDLSEYLDRHRSQRLVVIIAPVGEAESETYACGICGFVMNEVRACSRWVLSPLRPPAGCRTERDARCVGADGQPGEAQHHGHPRPITMQRSERDLALSFERKFKPLA
jgi:hypothetical protein